MQPLLDCLSDVKYWLSSNFFSLNESKTEVILFGGHMSRRSSVDFLVPLNPNICSSKESQGGF